MNMRRIALWMFWIWFLQHGGLPPQSSGPQHFPTPPTENQPGGGTPDVPGSGEPGCLNC